VSWLHQQLSDFHIEVRNVARQMLFQVAEKNSELKEQIVGMASDMLKPNQKTGRNRTVSCAARSASGNSVFSAVRTAAGLSRDEVSISAAWLIQLFPD